MNKKGVIVTTAVLGLVLFLAWGCQNSKPVGPMKYVSLKASVSTKGLAKPSQGEYVEVLYRVTGPSMNPVSGKVTVGFGEYTEVGANASAVRPLAASTVNFTLSVPAGPSRTLAVQVNYMGEILYAVGTKLTDPNRVMAVGATRFDIDPGTQVVNVPVEVGPLCRLGGIEGCYEEYGMVAYMGNTDLVNCAFVPNQEAFRENTCDAKSYFYGDSAPVDTIKGNARFDYNPDPEVGDVYCFWWEEGCHTWAQVTGDPDNMYWQYSQNCKFPFYGFDPEYSCLYR